MIVHLKKLVLLVIPVELHGLATKMLRPITDVVPRILPRNDNGQEDPIPDRDVHAVDTRLAHPRDQRPITHGVRLLPTRSLQRRSDERSVRIQEAALVR